MAALTADVVGLIRKTILDSYKYSDGFPILKELVQNANDAEASEMSIYFSSGIPNAKHELLKNPALIVYNNGKFTPRNERGIQRIADNNKETDNSKIGKFGLGMKSIFHLCDMFFYAVNTSKAANPEERVPYHLETINPWETDSDDRHSDWIDFNDEDKLLFERALPINMKEEQGFLLWIPGKTQDNSADHITQDFIDLTNPFNKGDIYTIVDKLKVTLALLSKVSPTKDSLKKININKEGKSISIELRDEKGKTYISESSDRQVENLVFESYKPNVKIELKQLTEKEYWNNNREKEIDCSLIFIKQPLKKEQTGKLHIQYCVYLPLENPEIEMDLDLDADYYVLLHGNFSVDSGRTGIQGYFGLLEDADIESVGDTETAIRYWNKILAQKVLYPNIPAFFNSIANSELLNLNLNETNSILKAISNYPDFGRVSLITGNKYTVSDKGLALCYKSTGTSLSKKWSLFDIEKGDNTNYVFIPDVEDYLLIDKVFPFIKDGKSNYICKSFSISSILPSRYEPAEETIEILLNEISFSEKKEIELLTSFLSMNGRVIEKSEKLQSTLLRSIKRNLLQTDINTLYSLRDSYKFFFEQVNNVTGTESLYKLYSVNLNKDRNTTGFEDKDWYDWWSLDSKFILLPGYLELNNSCSERALIEGSDTNDTKDSVCDFVATYITESSKQYFILSGIYTDIKQSINKIIAKYPYLHLFEIRNMQIGKNEYADSSLISQLKQDKELFYAIRPNDFEHVLYLYSQLIKSSEFSVYTISDAVIRRTGLDESGILTAESESIIESYSAHERFREYEYNTDILSKFLEALCSKKPNFKESESFHIRFLISSFDTTLNPDEELFIFDAQCNEVWRKIFDSCKGSVKIISPTFDSYTRDTIIQNEKILKISILNDYQCIKALRNACINNQVDFMKDDYYKKADVLLTILKELNYVTDKEIFYKLPIHINSKTNERQSCTEGCYLNALNPPIQFPPDFENPYVLFKLYDDEELAEKQKQFFGETKTLTYITAVKILLTKANMEKDYSRWIFEQIRNSGARDLSKYLATDEIGLLNWIPIRKSPGEFCNLRSIIPDGIFSAETEEIISSRINIFRLEDLDISSDNQDLLIARKLLIANQSEELNSIVDVLNHLQIDTIPVNSLIELKQISELLKDNKDFPQFSITWALFQDKNVKDQNKILDDFYSRIRGTNSDSYALFINMINSSIVGKKNTVDLFNKILEIIIKNHKEKYVISDISKYPVAGESIWKSPAEIAVSQSSAIIPDYRLNKATFEIMKDIISESTVDLEDTKDTEKILSDNTEPEEILETFRPWLTQLKQVKLFYIFLFLLKDNYKKTAIQHRNETDFECFTKDFSYSRKAESAGRIWNAGYTQEEAMEDKFTNPNRFSGPHFHTNITIPLGGEATLHSLNGDLVHVILESKEDVDDLFLEPPYYNDYSNKFYMPLAKISNNITDIDGKLKTLIRLILKKAYFQHDEAEIQRVLNTISQSNEYSVKATSIQIMDEIFGLFKQLGLNTDESVKSFTKEERELSRGKATGKLSSEEYASEKEKLIQKLQSLIEGTEEINIAFQKTLHNAVMTKISDNQYDENSVLFELLQNADDAVKDIISTEPKTTFEVEFEKNSIIVSHYGREINQTPVGEDPSKYLDDLYNMLTFSSNKSKVDKDTGKFGLGFKSVHLVTDNPIIRSGDLQFEIIGGMYPRAIPDVRLNPGETRITLPLKTGKSKEYIISDFKKNATLQTLFCKCIDCITVEGTDYWASKSELGNYSTGTVFEISTSDEKQYLLFENLDAHLPFQILFRLSDHKTSVIEMKKSDGRKIWNITPLSDGENLPFAINSDFVPDTGRKHLADKKNDLILAEIANEYSHLLADYLKSDSCKYKNTMIDMLVASSNIREKFFNTFAKDILQDLFDVANGMIANGFGSIVDNKRKLVYIEPTSYGLDADRSSDFMDEAQGYLDFVTNNKYYLISGVAKKCYTEEQLKGIEQIRELSEFLTRYVQDKRLDNEVLSAYLALLKHAERAPLNMNWELVYLHTNTDKWVKASTIIIEDSDIQDNQHLHSEYQADVLLFLKDNLPKDALIRKLSGITSEEYDDDIPTPPIPDVPHYTVREVYDWWVQEKDSGRWKQDIEDYYENKRFPSILSSGLKAGAFMYSPEELFSLQEGTIPKEWCQLLWIAAAQSMPYNWGNRDASNRIGMQVLESMGVFNDFCDGVNLQEVYDKYLDATKTDETRIRLFEMLLRIHKYRRNFAEYYDLWKNLPNRTNDNIIQGFLVSSSDEELSGCGIQLAPGNRTFSIGYRLIIQNLALCGFWNSISEENMKKLFKVFRGLKDYEFNLDGLPNVKEFYSCLDLPFLIYPGRNA